MTTASNNKKVVRGKRYTPEEKSKVVSFVTDFNTKNGRGGQSAAAAKFGISQLTIATWLKNAGLKSGGKTTSSSSNIQKKLGSMLKLGQEIEKMEADLKLKRKQFDSLKASL